MPHNGKETANSRPVFAVDTNQQHRAPVPKQTYIGTNWQGEIRKIRVQKIRNTCFRNPQK